VRGLARHELATIDGGASVHPAYTKVMAALELAEASDGSGSSSPMISKRSPPRPWLGHDRNELAEADESAAAGRPTPQLVALCGRSSSPGSISTDGAPTTTPRKSA
jgi:hypothetical protein